MMNTGHQKRNLLKKVFLCSLLCTLPFLLSGCFLRLLVVSFGLGTEEEPNARFTAAVSVGLCEFGEIEGLGDCFYFFDSEGGQVEEVSSFELIKEFGLFGVLIDPVILQVPAGLNVNVATFNGGTGPRPLTITTVNSFFAQPGTEIVAEAGQKFLIVEFPPDVPPTLPPGDPRFGAPFTFNVELALPALAPLNIKPMFAGKVEVNGQTFFPPLFPCTTNFGSIPSIQIPVSPIPQDLLPQIVNAILQGQVSGCAGQVYDYTGVVPPENVNDRVSFVPITSTFNTTTDTTSCPASFDGKFSFLAKLMNMGSSFLSRLFAQVAVLTGDNLLKNADGGPGGVGSRLTIPRRDEFSDGVLGPGEFVDVPFEICLKQRQPFQFFVDVLGVTNGVP